MATPAAQQFRLTVSDIDRALCDGEFRVVYQPKVDLATNRVTAAEAFVRWQHPKFGLLPPGLFLDFVESAERAADLTYFVMVQGVQAAAQWRAAGRDWALSVNVSPSDLQAEGFVEAAADLCRRSGLPHSAFVVETPERALLGDAPGVLETLADLRALGFHTALDGGGVVPVDLAQNHPAPFTSIKVGGQGMLRLAARLGPNGAGAIAARLRYARSTGLEAVAVGAESEETLTRLKDCGFTAVQGIWIQRPLPLDQLLAWNGDWVRGRDAVALPSPLAAKPAPDASPPEPQPELNAAPPANKKSRLSADVLERIRAQAAKAADPAEAIEDIEVTGPKRASSFAEKGEACLPMAHLVERRAKPNDAKPEPASRRASLLDPVFGG